MVVEEQRSIDSKQNRQNRLLETVRRSSTLGSTSANATLWCFWMMVIFVGSLLRVAAVFHNNPTQILTTDPGRWWHEATNLSTPEPITGIDAFGYQLWLGLLLKLVGTRDSAIAAHTSVLSVLTPWVWHRFVREVTEDRDLPLITWAALCWLPSWISIFSYTMSETLFLPLLGTALWLTFRSRKIESTKSFSLAALFWAMASATRVYALPFAVVMLVWTRARDSEWKRKLCFAALAFSCVAIPLSVRCHSLLRVWDPFGFPTMNQIYMESGKRTLRFEISRDNRSQRWIYEFGSPSLYERPFSPLSEWRSTRQGFVTFSINEDHGRTDWSKALENNQPSWRTRLHSWLENYIFFNFAPSWPDNNPNRFWDRAAIAFRWIWAPLGIVVSIFGIWNYRNFELSPRIVVLVTAMAWLFTPLLPAVMEGRYRKPVEGLLIIAILLILRTKTRARSEFLFIREQAFI